MNIIIDDCQIPLADFARFLAERGHELRGTGNGDLKVIKSPPPEGRMKRTRDNVVAFTRRFSQPWPELPDGNDAA